MIKVDDNQYDKIIRINSLFVEGINSVGIERNSGAHAKGGDKRDGSGYTSKPMINAITPLNQP
jgi:hypothetical protein